MKDPQLIARAVVSGLAILVAILHNWLGPFNLDNATIALLIVAALPWLSFLFKTIEVPGIGKFELQDFQRRLEEATGAAESASIMVSFVAPEPPPEPEPAGPSPTGPKEKMTELAAEYNHIRETQRSGSMRTANMTRVVRQMVDLVPNLSDFDVKGALDAEDRGLRLSGYAYLFAKPDYEMIEPLVQSVTEKEDKPFGQYWGLKAISRVLSQRREKPVPSKAIAQLHGFAMSIRRGTDRDYELRKIFRELKPGEED